jgi:hypothetical protein
LTVTLPAAITVLAALLGVQAAQLPAVDTERTTYDGALPRLKTLRHICLSSHVFAVRRRDTVGNHLIPYSSEAT